MKAITPMTNLKKDIILDGLLTKRKAPLSAEGLQQTLQDLTSYIARNGIFYAAVFPKKEVKGMSEFTAADIDKADIMQADDNELYFPVFSDYEKLRKFRPEPKENEVFCIVTKEDLLSFLQLNGKIAACVLNPMEDDLLMHRVLLQNLITAGKDLNSSY